MLKTTLTSCLALALMTGTASALVVTNKDSAEHTIGIDMGSKERVETLAAGASVDLSADCKDGCGITGPWFYSRLVKTGEDFAFDKNGII